MGFIVLLKSHTTLDLQISSFGTFHFLLSKLGQIATTKVGLERVNENPVRSRALTGLAHWPSCPSLPRAPSKLPCSSASLGFKKGVSCWPVSMIWSSFLASEMPQPRTTQAATQGCLCLLCLVIFLSLFLHKTKEGSGPV